MTDTLDSIHQLFVEYRQHHRMGAYPLILRRRAVAALTPSQQLLLAARLKLTADQVRRWAPQGEQQRVAEQEFFEVPGVNAAPPTAAHGLRIEVEMASGAVLRMQGEVGEHAIRVLVAALQTKAVAA